MNELKVKIQGFIAVVRAFIEKRLSPMLGEGRWLAAAFAAFCLANVVEIRLQNSNFASLTAYLEKFSPARFWTVLLVTTLILWIASVLLKTKLLIPSMLLAFSVIYAVTILFDMQEDLAMQIACCLIVFLVCRYIMQDDKLALHNFKFSHKTTKIFAVVVFILFSVAISYGTVLRYQSYYTTAFDFGIFAQMFENMRTTGLPTTTCERNEVLSHFGVHFSPIYYLVLPLYYIIPRPETLLVVQAVVIAAGVFPLCGIGRLIGISPKANTAFTAIYILFPAFGAGAFYDFHENAFLAVPLLFTIYFMLKKKDLWMFVSALVLLSVKEDAAIYVFSIALYIMFSKRGVGRGLMLFGMALVYFFAASAVISNLGNGIMDNRLSNYWPESSTAPAVGSVVSGTLVNGKVVSGTLFDVLKTCIYDFAYAITQIFTQDKLSFLIVILMPVMFTPLFARRTNVLLLLIPLVVINLMSNWKFQYTIGFQYIFGTGALIIVASMLNVQPMKAATRQSLLASGVAISFVLTCCYTLSEFKLFDYVSSELSTSIVDTDSCIEQLPEDAAITAFTAFVPQLYQHDSLYVYPIKSNKRTEYLIMDNRFMTDEDKDELDKYSGGDYTLTKTEGFCDVYQLTDAAQQRLQSSGLLIE